MYLLIVAAATFAAITPVLVLVFSTDPHRNRDDTYSPLRSSESFDAERVGMAPLDLSAMDVTASMITQSGVIPPAQPFELGMHF